MSHSVRVLFFDLQFRKALLRLLAMVRINQQAGDRGLQIVDNIFLIIEFMQFSQLGGSPNFIHRHSRPFVEENE
jgi:hypothetical protein